MMFVRRSYIVQSCLLTIECHRAFNWVEWKMVGLLVKIWLRWLNFFFTLVVNFLPNASIDSSQPLEYFQCFGVISLPTISHVHFPRPLCSLRPWPLWQGVHHTLQGKDPDLLGWLCSSNVRGQSQYSLCVIERRAHEKEMYFSENKTKLKSIIMIVMWELWHVGFLLDNSRGLIYLEETSTNSIKRTSMRILAEIVTRVTIVTS